MALGSPATELGGSTGKVLTEHPLLRAMRQAEQHEMMLREVVRKKFRGGVDTRTVLGASPSARLRLSRSQQPEPPRITLHRGEGDAKG